MNYLKWIINYIIIIYVSSHGHRNLFFQISSGVIPSSFMRLARSFAIQSFEYSIGKNPQSAHHIFWSPRFRYVLPHSKHLLFISFTHWLMLVTRLPIPGYCRCATGYLQQAPRFVALQNKCFYLRAFWTSITSSIIEWMLCC